MSGPTRRLFLAIDLPAGLARRLADTVPRAAGVRPVPCDSMHLTLHFLGAVAVEAIPGLIAALDRVRSAPFVATVADRGRFPPRGPARVLWFGLGEQAVLRDLHAACGRALRDAGLATEHRLFVPHVTVARLTPTAGRQIAESFLAGGSLGAAAFPVTGIVLYASTPTPAGPRHEPQHLVPLRS